MSTVTWLGARATGWRSLISKKVPGSLSRASLLAGSAVKNAFQHSITSGPLLLYHQVYAWQRIHGPYITPCAGGAERGAEMLHSSFSSRLRSLAFRQGDHARRNAQ